MIAQRYPCPRANLEGQEAPQRLLYSSSKDLLCLPASRSLGIGASAAFRYTAEIPCHVGRPLALTKAQLARRNLALFQVEVKTRKVVAYLDCTAANGVPWISQEALWRLVSRSDLPYLG